MRILKIIHGYPPLYQAGSEVYSQSLCNELARQGHEVAVFTREEDPYRPDFDLRRGLTDEGLPLYCVNLPRGKDGFAHPELEVRFRAVLDEWGPQAAHFGHLNHLSTGLVRRAKDWGAATVFTLHDFWMLCPRGQFLQTNFGQAGYYSLCSGQDNAKCARSCYSAFATQDGDTEDLDYWAGWAGKRMAATDDALRYTDVLLAPSRHLMDVFLAHKPELGAKLRLLRYGFLTQYLTQTQQPETRSGYTFGYIGTHIPAKGVNLLIEAFRQLLDGGTPARLLIWGRENGQSTRALRQMAGGLPVEFRGEYVNRNIADEVFRRIDCLVVPSIWTENAPLVIQEAQQCRVPVITAAAGGMAELVRHSHNGLLFRHRDADSLCGQMRFAATNPGQTAAMGRRGFLYTETGDVHPISSHAQELVRIYRQTCQLPL